MNTSRHMNGKSSQKHSLNQLFIILRAQYNNNWVLPDDEYTLALPICICNSIHVKIMNYEKKRLVLLHSFVHERPNSITTMLLATLRVLEVMSIDVLIQGHILLLKCREKIK